MRALDKFILVRKSQVPNYFKTPSLSSESGDRLYPLQAGKQEN
jgi:hypothetical protein